MRSVTDSPLDAIAAGDLARAELLSRQILESNAEDLTARLILGVSLARTRRYAEAVEQLKLVLSSDPNSADALTWISDALRKLGRYEDALGHAEHASRLVPLSSDPAFTAGMCLIALGRYPEAEVWLRKVVTFSRSPQPLHYLGVALMRQEKLSEAVVVLEEAQRREPKHPIHLVAIGQAKLLQRKYEDAQQLVTQALVLAPDYPAASLLMAQIMAQEGMPAECEAFIDRVLAANPNSAEGHGLMGMYLQQMGRFSEAENHLNKSLELDPQQATPLFCKIQNNKIGSNDSSLVEQMLEQVGAPSTSSHEKVVLEYALGKAFDDLGEATNAMMHYDSANRVSYGLYRQAEPWDKDGFDRLVDRTIELFTEPFLQEWQEFGNPSERPIFVLGMIRSGTTLMEQMLSSHSNVVGAGEVWFWMDEGVKCLDKTGVSLDRGRMSELSAKYLHLLSKSSPDARFVTDKMPGNVTVLGFIHACLPNARIVHMVRDPIDTCLSIWTTYFRKPPEFGSHKGHIIHAFRQHERLREHWRKVLPEDRFLEVKYEGLTADPESAIRKVLAFCDLDWDPACARPQDNTRFVSTPSVWRVRRPVDRSSVNKKERYGALLGEFLSLENTL